MVIVASELSEAQKDRLTISFSLQGMNVAVYTLEAMKTVFVELFLYAEKLHAESFTPSEQTRQQHEQNLHRRMC